MCGGWGRGTQEGWPTAAPEPVLLYLPVSHLRLCECPKPFSTEEAYEASGSSPNGGTLLRSLELCSVPGEH